MDKERTTKEVFEAWGGDYHADGMENEHWPRVKQAFELIQPSSGNYLEIGVGNGYGLAHMATKQFADGRCLGMDLSTTMVERTRERTKGLANVEVEAGDFLARDFGERRFDTIFSMEVFYYFPDMNDGLRKAFAILNPGGTLWVAVNFYEENAESAEWPKIMNTHMQRWSAAQYVEGFERAGFISVEQKMIEAPTPEGSKHGDAPTLLTFGTKP